MTRPQPQPNQFRTFASQWQQLRLVVPHEHLRRTDLLGGPGERFANAMLEHDRLVLIWDLLVHDRAVPGRDRRVQASRVRNANPRSENPHTHTHTDLLTLA